MTDRISRPPEPSAELPSTNRRLARNMGYNFAGQVVPLVAALVAIPILIRSLGTARFGILTLVWGGIGYFNLFDLGIGRALTHAVAARSAAHEYDDLAVTTWTSLALLVALGAAGGVVCALLTPRLVDGWLNVPVALHDEARAAFYIMGLSLPFSLGATGLRGIMEGFQDFHLSTMLRAPLGVLQFVLPLFVLPFSHALAPVVWTLCALRALSFVLHAVICLMRYAPLRHDPAIRPSAVLPLLRYGGWITVSNVVSPLMGNMDRFIIGALLPMSAVAYYVTPYELVSKLFIVPGAILGVIFPAFSTVFVNDRERAALLVDQSVRAIFVLVLPVVLVLVTLANEGLALWISPDFATHSAPVLQWLAAGVVMNCAGQVAATALQGAGWPHVTGKVNLIELPLYLGLVFVLAKSFGLVGVAMAWTIRVSIDAVVLFAFLSHECPETRTGALRALRIHAGAAVLLAGLSQLPSMRARVVGAALGLALCAFWTWTRLLRREERAILSRVSGFAVSR